VSPGPLVGHGGVGALCIMGLIFLDHILGAFLKIRIMRPNNAHGISINGSIMKRRP